MRNSVCYFFLLLLTYFICKCFSLESSSNLELQPKLKSFQTFVENVIKCRKVTGAAITLVKENEVVFKMGFGYENVEKKIPATEKTKFCVGSLTKAFTSTLIAKLLDKQESITWDTPIRDILGPSFKLADSLRTENVNLRDCLAHKVGTPPFFNALLVGFPENETREEFVRYLEYQPTVTPFRTKFLYSNYMYTLAGYVAEKLGKKTWEDLVREMLFEPLNMCRSGFVDKITDFNGFALPYAYLNGTAVALNMTVTHSVHPLGPAGSIYSTADDMGKWIIYHLNNLKKVSDKELKENVLETYRGQMHTPFQGNDWYKPKYPVDDVYVSYNMGWITSAYRGFQRYWHTGGIITYSSYLGLYPSKRAGVFISLTGSENNENSLPIKALSKMASDWLLDETPWLNDTSACATPPPWDIKEPATLKDKNNSNENNTSNPKYNVMNIDKYLGVYGHPAFGQINVVSDNKSNLILEFGRFGRMELFPVKKGEFDGKFLDLLWFLTEGDGQTLSFNITFVFSHTDSIVGIKFPVDQNFERILFKKNCILSDQTWSNSDVDDFCVTSASDKQHFRITFVLYFVVFSFLCRMP